MKEANSLATLIASIALPLVVSLSGCSDIKDTFSRAETESREPHNTHTGTHDAEHMDETDRPVENHEHHEEGVVHLDPARLASLDLTTAVVHGGTVTTTLAVPAEVKFDPDQVAHLVPRVAGIVREVHAGIGDVVAEGDLMAVLDSRELASAKSTYLEAVGMRDLAQSTFERETRLYKQEVSSEQEYLEAKQAYEETQIKVRTAEQQLHALGLSNEYIEKLPAEDGASLTRYEIHAPFNATVIERHITQGETVGLDDQVYFIAKLDPVWIMGRATERDIRKLAIGQRAVVELDAFPGQEFEGRIDYVGSALDPQSRTAEVRVVLANPDQALRAGMFGRMTVFLEEHEHPPAMLVPVDAVQRTETGNVVFRLINEGEYEIVHVTVLHESEDFVEIEGPLQEGDVVAAGDTFVLKSEAGKEAMGGGHSH